mmetsp:Transcript_83185/g.209671  ORF Transcript_83185/g.209671 Transcript_83185/m.209671 type:complete len:381 (+) Transcript_83185:381-1523(+)
MSNLPLLPVRKPGGGTCRGSRGGDCPCYGCCLHQVSLLLLIHRCDRLRIEGCRRRLCHSRCCGGRFRGCYCGCFGELRLVASQRTVQGELESPRAVAVVRAHGHMELLDVTVGEHHRPVFLRVRQLRRILRVVRTTTNLCRIEFYPSMNLLLVDLGITIPDSAGVAFSNDVLLAEVVRRFVEIVERHAESLQLEGLPIQILEVNENFDMLSGINMNRPEVVGDAIHMGGLGLVVRHGVHLDDNVPIVFVVSALTAKVLDALRALVGPLAPQVGMQNLLDVIVDATHLHLIITPRELRVWLGIRAKQARPRLWCHGCRGGAPAEEHGTHHGPGQQRGTRGEDPANTMRGASRSIINEGAVLQAARHLHVTDRHRTAASNNN